jgi:tetratricopeptide (TPR) repeat protein
MTDLPERAAETALEDLTDRSILTSDLSAQTYFLPPLTAKFIRTRRPEAVTQTGDALTNRAYALAMQYGGFDNYEGFKILDTEWELLAAALPRLLTGDNDRLQTVCGKFYKFLDFSGRLDNLLWLSEQAKTRALAAQDQKSAGWLSYYIGNVYRARNQPAEVLYWAAQAELQWENDTPHQKAFALQLRGMGYELQKDYSAALTNFRKALKIWQAESLKSDDVSRILNHIAWIEVAIKNYDAAEHDFQKALRIAKKNKHRENEAIITGRLAALALERKQWGKAETLALEALLMAEEIGRHNTTASNCRRLAIALLKQERVQESLPYARRAVEIYERSHSKELPEAQATLAEIEEKIKE